jgi:prepilin-type N-terminal cleavage/methylation domain-containing protein
MLKRRGLTIVELLVVLAIIATLIGLLAPAVLAMRERARETTCKNNVHQLNLAMAQYADAHKDLPHPAAPGTIGGWMVEVLPFIEQENLQDTIPLGSLIADAPESLFVPPAIFRCPRRSSLDGSSREGVTPGHYVFVPMSRRDSFDLFDSPTTLSEPWLNGPEMTYETVTRSTGPHHGGFHFARGFQQGVDFMEGGGKAP